MNPHIRRLYADWEGISALLKTHSHISLVDASGDPPEKYVMEYTINGLTESEHGDVFISNKHRVEIFLPLDYPRKSPLCRMLTPVFHPNISPQKICIGDHWSAGESLPLLMVRIGEMIAFQSYNIKSPLNAKAAMWTEENMSRLPIDKTDLQIGL